MLTNRLGGRFALGFISAVLWALAMPPYGFWPLGWFALVPLLIALPGASAKRAALIGCFSGTVANYLCFYWVLELMQKFSNLGPFAYLCMLVMAMYQSIPWAIWCYILGADASMNISRYGTARALVFAVCSWVALEFFFPIVFPYYLADSQYKFALTNSLVELGGVSLLTFAIMLVNLCLARAFISKDQDESYSLWPACFVANPPRIYAGVALGAILLTAGWHFVAKHRVDEAIARAPRLAVGVVQPNEWIGDRSALEGLFDYQRLTHQLASECLKRNEALDLVLWPESAVRTPHPVIQRRAPDGSEPVTLRADLRRRYPLDVGYVLPSELAPEAAFAQEESLNWDDRLALQRGYKIPILLGTTLEDVTPGARGPIKGRPPLYNSALLVDSDGYVKGAVEKVKLLMFGETVPGSSIFPQIYDLLPSSSALLAGSEPGVIDFEGKRLGIMICYEDLLPWFHYQLAKKKPQILLNLTNDAWFGKTVEPYSHMALATLRAVEGRCYLVRSTPSGVSCVIDPYGQVVASIDSDTAGTLREEVALLDVNTGFECWGNIFAWLCLAYSIAEGFAWWKTMRR